jgi:hypothetical protein
MCCDNREERGIRIADACTVARSGSYLRTHQPSLEELNRLGWELRARLLVLPRRFVFGVTIRQDSCASRLHARKEHGFHSQKSTLSTDG